MNADRRCAPPRRTDSTADGGSGAPVTTIHVHGPSGSTRSGTAGVSATSGAAGQRAASAHT